MSDFRNYDPQRVIVSFAGIRLSGYMDGTFITVERTTDTFSVHVGADGDQTRVRSRDRSGTVTVTLKAEAAVNDQLTAKLVLDENFGTGYGPLFLKDLNGTTIAQATNAWLKRPANLEYSADASGREWQIECGELLISGGGAIL